MVEQAVLKSVDALQRHDVAAAHKIYAADQHVNEKRYEIENAVLTLIATQQPMARDLRFLAAILEINTELERMGDYAKGICKVTILLSEKSGANQPVISLTEFQHMAGLGLDMLHRALSAFVARDAATARAIPAEDDQVDALYNRVYHELIQKTISSPEITDEANHLMWAAHNLERLADRVTNICERIVFVVTGEMRELDSSDDEAKR